MLYQQYLFSKISKLIIRFYDDDINGLFTELTLDPSDHHKMVLVLPVHLDNVIMFNWS